jgi:adenine-specific DNA-methyltransferase
LTARKAGGNTRYPWNGVTPPPGRYWAYSYEKMQQMEADGRLVYSASGMPYMKRYLDESKGVQLQDWWDDISMLRGISKAERLGYPTQKPEALLDRIIRASSNENDLVLDCFCGSGTTAAVAEKLGRRWIACNLGRFAIHTTRKRLLNIEGVKPFLVQNLGKYERQLWQTGAFAEGGDRSLALAAGLSAEAERQRKYTEFILRLYNARPLSGGTMLHGVKNGRLVHVGGVEAPVSDGDVRQIAVEFARRMGTGKDAPTTNGVDLLGWDFAFEVNEISRQQAERANLNLRFLRIPRDVMDKRAVDQGDVKFFELAALSVAVKSKRLDVSLSLSDFVIPPDDVPEDVRTAVKHWSQWIDYWAVDWDHDGKTFHNQWQTFRTRKQPKLEAAAVHSYEAAGEYNVMVKVIDILGNDTTKTIKVSVK